MPLVPLVRCIHGSVVVADQDTDAVTSITALPPSEEKFRNVGLMLSGGGGVVPPWLTWHVLPDMVIVPERLAVPVFWSTVKWTVPLPVPLAAPKR